MPVTTLVGEDLLDREALAELAPASTAASTSNLSSTVRREQYPCAIPSIGCGEPAIVSGPKSNE